MAINPAAEYPGQIITGLPGFPYGKAVNVAVSGDGTGTPLEAKWLSDLFGFLQSLLVAATIVPSGSPDEVGASDYKNALDALYPAIGRMTTAETDINALEASRVTGPASATDEAFARFDSTTGKLIQNGVVKATDAGAVTGVSSLTLSDEVLYTAAKSCSAFVVHADFEGFGWAPPTAGGGAPVRYIQGTSNRDIAYARVDLPRGAIVSEVTVRIKPGTAQASPSNRMYIEAMRYTWSSGAATPSRLTGWTEVYDDGTTNVQVRTVTAGSPYAMQANEILVIEIAAGAAAASAADRIYSAEVSYTIPGPR